VGRRLVSPLPALIFVLVAALAVGGFFAVRESVASQQSKVLDSDASQLTLILQEAVQQIAAELKPLAAVASATDDSPTVFEKQAKLITSSPGESVAIVEGSRGSWVVKLAAGPSLAKGQTLAPQLAAIASRARGANTLGTQVFELGGHQAVGFAVGPPFTVAGTAVVQTDVIHPAKQSKSESGPYKGLEVALYAAPTALPSQLVASSTGRIPLAPPVARTFLNISGNRWLVLVRSDGPLVGGWLRNSQWIVLAAGLLLAVLAGFTAQVQARRKSYADELVAERTAELVASQEELVRKERLAALGELASVVGHELRNPLGASTNALFLTRQRLGPNPDPDVARHLTMMENQIGRAVALCEDLTMYVRQREPRPTDLELRRVVDEALAATPPPPGTEVTVDAEAVKVKADESMLLRVVTNLVTNAYQAMPSGGSLRIGAATSNGYDLITFEDTGEGIHPDTQAHLFDPFFTTKADGTGLGLAIVHRIVEAHKGSISIENATGGGAVVTVKLPRNTGRSDK
jgi:signal transduction histidine kinase